MENYLLTKHKLLQNLKYLSDDKLKKVEDFVEILLSDEQIPKKNNESLAGIWEGLGFEKLLDLDKEVDEIRSEIYN